MIREYALQPELLSTWERFRYLSEKFGYDRGRVISRFPKRWEKMVYESLKECRPVEKKRIEVGLKRLKKALHARQGDWNNNITWLRNALEEHERQPFNLIIS